MLSNYLQNSETQFESCHAIGTVIFNIMHRTTTWTKAAWFPQ